MNKNKNLIFFPVLICSALPGLCNAGGSVDTDSRDAFADKRYTHPRYEVVQTLRSDCRRYGVVWSGGVASRFSDRISPRPVRSRWQRDGINRIQCSGVDAFRQRRVSDRPWIR